MSQPMKVKFAAEVSGRKILVIKDRYSLTAKGSDKPSELKVRITAADVSPLPMSEGSKILVLHEDMYAFSVNEMLFEKDIVRFKDKNGDIQFGEVIYDAANGISCIRTAAGKKHALFNVSDCAAVGSALLGDAPEQFETVKGESTPADAEMGVYNIYTDGSCLENPGTCGAGFVVLDGDGVLVEEESIPIGFGTNNVAELTALGRALEFALAECTPGKITVLSDSQYLVKGITEWSAKWIRNEWRTASGEPVKNRELWIRLLELCDKVKERFSLDILWVKGHDNNIWNERADALASEAALQAAKGVA